MQSRLSEASSRPDRPLRTRRSLKPASGSTPFGMSRLRERAGTILSRKRASTAGTNNSDPSTPGARNTVHAQRERDIEESEQQDREEGYGRSLGAGQLFAPPEPPRA